jgi:2-keto-4-pentenoate hydratase
VSDVDPRVASALRTQIARRQGERAGWKIGLNVPEIQAALGLREPVVGSLTSATRVAGSYAAGNAVELRAEAEVAIEVGPSLTAARFAAAIELVDVGRPPPGGLEAIVEENIFHRGFVVGGWVDEAPTGEARMWVGDELRASVAAAVDAAGTVDVVGRHLAGAGEDLRPGDLIIAGAVITEPVAPGDDVVVEIDGLGRVEVAIV